ncbi:hypothetical protein RB597_003157 [Gaeumannomyces tritici]
MSVHNPSYRDPFIAPPVPPPQSDGFSNLEDFFKNLFNNPQNPSCGSSVCEGVDENPIIGHPALLDMNESLSKHSSSEDLARERTDKDRDISRFVSSTEKALSGNPPSENLSFGSLSFSNNLPTGLWMTTLSSGTPCLLPMRLSPETRWASATTPRILRYFRLYPVDERFKGVRQPGPVARPQTRPTWDFDSPEHGATKSAATEATSNLESPDWAPTLNLHCSTFRALINDCTANHSACAQPNTSLLPSRLLRIFGSVTLPAVHLQEVSDISRRPVRYMCLSYCWGGPQAGMTTSARVSSYIRGIHLSALPKTVLDAVRVTLSLGMKYLWVDAFCIIQDSTPDKNTELKKMSAIYAGAACTICAASSRAATEGFLDTTTTKETEALNVSTWHADILDDDEDRAAVLEMRSDASKSDISEEPLFARGWTFQETLLSPRVIMFFEKGQRPCFRCPELAIRSDGGRVLQFPKPLMHLGESLATLETIEGEPWETTHAVSEEWHSLVTMYSGRELKFPKDRLPAIMGIVTSWENSRLALGTYRAGLWSHDIWSDLVWRSEHVSPRKAHESYVAPSWSWASRAHAVHYMPRGDINPIDEHCAGIISCEVVPVSPDVPNGAIRSGTLVINCKAEEFTVPDHELASDLMSARFERFSFDFDDYPRPQGVNKVWLLTIAQEEPWNNVFELGIGVIEVQADDRSAEKLFKRVGMFRGKRWVRTPRSPKRRFVIV